MILVTKKENPDTLGGHLYKLYDKVYIAENDYYHDMAILSGDYTANVVSYGDMVFVTEVLPVHIFNRYISMKKFRAPSIVEFAIKVGCVDAVRDLVDSSAECLVEYARGLGVRLTSEQERIVATDSMASVFYARHIKGEFPLGHDAIKRSSVSMYAYAELTRSRLKDGEESLKSCGKAAAKYMIAVGEVIPKLVKHHKKDITCMMMLNKHFNGSFYGEFFSKSKEHVIEYVDCNPDKNLQQSYKTFCEIADTDDINYVLSKMKKPPSKEVINYIAPKYPKLMIEHFIILRTRSRYIEKFLYLEPTVGVRYAKRFGIWNRALADAIRERSYPLYKSLQKNKKSISVGGIKNFFSALFGKN